MTARLILYDASQTQPVVCRSWRWPARLGGWLGGDPRALAWWWRVGGHWHGRDDCRVVGVHSWQEALGLLAAGPPLRWVQIWCHGESGRIHLGDSTLGGADLQVGSERWREISAWARRCRPDTLVWFRCCKAFHGSPGKRFAEQAARVFGARVMGHTYVIGHWQSGTHSVRPGTPAAWPDEEGGHVWSHLGAPNTLPAVRRLPPVSW